MTNNKDTFSIGDLVRVKGTKKNRCGVITGVFSTGVGSDEVTITWLHEGYNDSLASRNPLTRYLAFYLDPIEIDDNDRVC